MPTRGGNPRITIQADASEVDRATRDAERSLDRLGKAGARASTSLRTSVGGAGSKFGVALGAGLTPLAGLAAGAGVLAGAAFSKSITGALDTQEANNKLKAQLGLSTKESARLGRIAGKVYAANYGDSLEEVNGAIKSVVTDIDGMRKASGSRLKGITGDVISLSKAFDQDLGGVTRAVGQMMRTGLADNAQEALNVITVGLQSGDDKAGDFLDTLNEYGTQFRKLGLDGKAATGLISQGLKAGARDSDLVADSLKEFSIRAVDGSTTTAAGFKALGLDAEKMSEKIAKGGAPAAKGLDQVLDRLRAIKDPVKQSQAAVQLFGTQAEDLGKALFALDPSKAASGMNKVEGAARRVNSTMGSGAKSQVTALKRELEVYANSLGSKVAPAIGVAAGKLTGFFRDARNGKGAFSGVGTAVDQVKAKISAWVTRNRGDINSVVNAFKTVGRFAKEVFQDVMLPIVRRTMNAIGPIVDGLVHTIRGLVRLVSGLLSGNWSKAWSGAKEAVGGAFKAIKTLVVTEAGNIWDIIKKLGPKLVKGIVTGLKNMGSALATGIFEGIKAAAKAIPGLAGDALKGIGKGITSAISKGFGALNPFGDGIGMTPPTSGFSGGNGLMGAKSTMGWVASAAGRFGLHTSSGRRPGAITSSGNVSYHSSGDALDEAGTPAAMMGFFRYMKAKYGPILRELIYTPGGIGIKDGKPFRYSGQVAADHYDHVHTAFVGAMPRTGDGIGDGIGQAVTAARSAGFRGDDLVEAVAIAGAETGGKWDAEATNFKYPDHSIGFWQINQLAHKGRFGTDQQLKNPYTNAKAAYTLFKESGFRPWSTYPAAARAFLAQARAAISGGSGSGSSGSKKTIDTKTIHSAGSAPVMDNSVIYGSGDTAALDPAQAFANAQGRAPVKGRVGTGPVKGVDMGVQDARQAILDNPPPAGPTHEDYIRANIARSRLTDSNSDDILYTTELRDYLKGQMDTALADGDPRNDEAAISAYQEVVEALKGLTGATEEANRLQEARDAVNQQIADNGSKMVALAMAADGLQSQFIAWLSSQIGAPVSRGIQAAGTPGVMARY